jgi:lipoprotein-releasing system permease protein
MSVTRQLKILEFALAATLRQRGRNFSILIVYTLVIAVLASVLFLTRGLKEEATQLLAKAPELVVQRIVAGRHDLIPLDYGRVLKGIPGVGRVTPRVWGYYYDSLTGSNYTMMGTGEHPPEGLELLTGHLPQQSGECAIGAGVAGLRRTGPDGDLIIVDSRNVGVDYEVTGVFHSDSALLTNDLVLLGDADLRDFFGLPADRATDFSVEVYNPQEVETVAAKIKQRLPDTRPITRSEILRTYDSVFSWRSGMLLTLFSSALLAFCVLAWDKATGLSAEEKREIGILKAVGWDTADVLALKFWEGLILSLTALLLGLILAWVHVFWFDSRLLAPVLKGWSILFPPFALAPSVDLYQLCVIAFLTVTPYVASTVIPSWKAAITDPESMMRS